jgi:thiamine biosynthesis lipoprotein
MGTMVSIDVRDSVADQGLDEAFAWLRHVDERFSPYRMDSEVSLLDRGELGNDGPSREMREVLDLCLRLWTDTEGAFDARATGHFDPSGVVKGWAIEGAVRILESFGARNLCVNAGGDVAVRGEPEPGRAWRVGIRHPTDPARLGTVLELRGRIPVATSAAYERGGHVVEPRSGRQIVRRGSATVVGPDLGLADGYATALWVDGAEGIHWLHRLSGYEALLLSDERSLGTSGIGLLEAGRSPVHDPVGAAMSTVGSPMAPRLLSGSGTSLIAATRGRERPIAEGGRT